MQILKVALMVAGGLVGAIVLLVLGAWIAWWAMEITVCTLPWPVDPQCS